VRCPFGLAGLATHDTTPGGAFLFLADAPLSTARISVA